MEKLIPATKFQNPARPTYKECLNYFTEYLKKFPFISSSDLEGLDDYWESFSMPKKSAIVLPGEVCQHVVFLCKGAVKNYTEDSTKKYVINFATEAYFCTDPCSFINERPAAVGIICVKNSYGLMISLNNFRRLLEDRPAFARLYREVYEREMKRLMNRVRSFQGADAKGRYEILMKQNSAIFNYFTLQDISNYLGITPETLSRLRSEKVN